MAGEILPQVGKLTGTGGTARRGGYAHLTDGHLVETAERVGCLIVEAMAGLVAPR